MVRHPAPHRQRIGPARQPLGEACRIAEGKVEAREHPPPRPQFLADEDARTSQSTASIRLRR
jgi:hypothetical protein